MSRHLASYVGLLLLFVVSFVVLHWLHGYVIGFQRETNDCFFVFGRPFLVGFLDHPAGPLRYAGRFLGQFYHYGWLGALVVSACIFCFGLLFHRVLARLDGRVAVAQTLLPCVLLLALHTSTLWQVYDTLGLCASCGAFWGYLCWRRKWARRVYALAATPVVYLLLGAYVWLFVVWVVAYEWLDGPLRSGLAFKIGYVLLSIGVPLAAWRFLFMIPLRSALVCPLMWDPPFRTGSPDQTSAQWAADCILAGAFCVLLLVMPFWGRLFSGRRLAAFWRAKPGRRSRVALVLAIGVVAILLHWIRYDARLATFVACRQLYREKQWDALLERAKGNPFGDVRVQFMTNFALYHKGTLLEEMFRYPQPWGTRGLVLQFSGTRMDPSEDDTGVAMYNSDLFYEMGHVNAAFRHAYNSMALWEETYEIMERMAECSMANGNYEMAAKYLNVLERTLFHRDFARRYQAILADPRAAEREFADLRKRLPAADGFMFGHPAMPFLILLEAKPDNRMATEYLMAWLLLDKSETSIASICCSKGIEQFKRAGYTSIPTYCQEALLLWEKMGRAPVDLQGFRYDEMTRARVDRFFQDMAPHWDRQDAPEQARALYGETYVFYHFFVIPPSQAQRTMGARGGYIGTLRQE